MVDMLSGGGSAGDALAAIPATIAHAKPKPPPEMPDPFDPRAREARRQAMDGVGGRGRASTILTTPATRPIAAGQAYSGRTLGS